MSRAMLLVLIVGLSLLPSKLFGQSLQDFVVSSSSTVLAVSQPIGPGVGGVCDPVFTGTCVGPGSGITLAGLSSALGLSTLNQKIDGSFAAIADLNNRMHVINAQIASMNADLTRSLEIGAIAASMRDAIPNLGDRFAVRLNVAGFNGYAGGSVGVSMNVTDSVRLSANYGRGTTQNVVSGGLNISFR